MRYELIYAVDYSDQTEIVYRLTIEEQNVPVIDRYNSVKLGTDLV